MRSAIRLSHGSSTASALNAGSSALDLERRADRARSPRSGSTALAARAGDQRAHHQLLHRLVAGERIGVGTRQPLELAGAALRLDDDRRGEAAVDRQQRRLGDIVERDALLAPGRGRSAARAQISAPLCLADQRGPQRDRHRLLDRLPGRRRRHAARGAGSRVRAAASCSSRAVTFGVPAWLYQILNGDRSTPLASSSALHEIVAGRRLAVVPLEIEVGAGAEPLRAQARSRSSGSARRPCCRPSPCRSWRSRYSCRAGPGARAGPLLGELRRAQHAHVLDPLDRRRSRCRREKLWSRKTVKPSFRLQLEPVAAGDPVARPVVEIFVRDDARRYCRSRRRSRFPGRRARRPS